MFEETVVELANDKVEAVLVLLVAVVAVEAMGIPDVVFVPPPLPEQELLLAICWNLPSKRL
jgi:hypothetical protein